MSGCDTTPVKLAEVIVDDPRKTLPDVIKYAVGHDHNHKYSNSIDYIISNDPNNCYNRSHNDCAMEDGRSGGAHIRGEVLQRNESHVQPTSSMDYVRRVPVLNNCSAITSTNMEQGTYNQCNQLNHE